MNNQDKIASEAIDWVIRVERGMDGAGQDAFLDWLTADPRHGEEYARQNANWEQLDILADWRPEHEARPNRDSLAPARLPVLEWARNHWRALAGSALGGAAVAAACAALIVLRPFATTAPDATNDSTDAMPSTVYATKDVIPIIEQSTLNDGTIVELNRGASITVSFTPSERRVKLNQGEANFNVTNDPARPFVVDIDGVKVRATGTKFNIRRDAGSVSVLVTSGSVRVRPGPAGQASDAGWTTGQDFTSVKAGQMALVSIGATLTSVNVQTLALDKIENMIAWHPRMLDIEGQPLSNVVEEFNKCNAPIRLVIKDPDLENTEVSAILRSDQVENLVRLLVDSFQLKAQREGDVVTLGKIL